MISFIIIGRNIENTIQLCLDSVFTFIKENNILNHEVIYADSDSSDNTIKLTQEFPVQVLIIRGDINAAIGRNVGANIAKGEILFFIDGDMEIIPDFFPIAFQDEKTLKYPFCSGDFLNLYYDSGYIPQNKSEYGNGAKMDKDTFINTTGGLFIINAEYWRVLKGMDERLIRNQDLDFGIRMARKNIPLLRYKALLAQHHTINYVDKERIKSFLKSKYLLCYGILIRKHITYPKFFYSLLRSRYSIFILLSGVYFWPLIFLYIFIQILRVLKKNSQLKYFKSLLLFKVVSDLYCIIGTLFYYPSKKKYDTIMINSPIIISGQ